MVIIQNKTLFEEMYIKRKYSHHSSHNFCLKNILSIQYSLKNTLIRRVLAE